MSRYHIFWTNSSFAYLTAIVVMGFWWIGSVWDFALLFYLPDFHEKSWRWHGFWLLLWSVGLFWSARQFCQIKLWRYDKHSRNVIFGQWHKMGWHDLEIHHINQFIGIRAEEIHSAYTAQYGRIILLHRDGVTETEIHRVFPSKNGSLNTQYEHKNIAKIMQLPMLQLDKIDHAAQGSRTAHPEHFQAATTKTATWLLILRFLWAIVHLAVAGGLLYLGFWLFHANGGAYIWFLLALSILAVAFAAYALNGAYETWKIYQNNQSNTPIITPTPPTIIPVRVIHVSPQSATFQLFSRRSAISWTVFCTLSVGMILWIWFTNASFAEQFWAMLCALFCLLMGIRYWTKLMLNQKVIYNAQNDTFTFYKMDKRLCWQPEKTQAVNEFIGISVETNQNEIWLIGAAGSQDVFLGNSNKPNIFIKKINEKTGLPILKNKTR